VVLGILALLAPFLADEDCHASLARARQAYDQHRYAAARDEFTRAVVACGESASLLSALGKAQMLDGHFAEAEKTFDHVLTLEPNNGGALRLKADAQYFLGRDRDAEKTLLDAIRIDPRNEESIYALGRMYYQQSRYEQALDQFRKVLAIDPKSYKAYDNLGLCHEAMNDNAQAIQNYLRALDLVAKDHPDYDWPYGNLANLMLKMGDYRKAFDLGVEASKRNPNSARNFFLTGKALTKLDKYELSVRWLKRAGELDPDYAEPRYLLGQVYKRLGKNAEARRELEAFQEINKKVPRNRR